MPVHAQGGLTVTFFVRFWSFHAFSHYTFCSQKLQKSLEIIRFQDFFLGPSGEIRTHGLMVPNHARYQLRYTRICNYLFCIAEQ